MPFGLPLRSPVVAAMMRSAGRKRSALFFPVQKPYGTPGTVFRENKNEDSLSGALVFFCSYISFRTASANAAGSSKGRPATSFACASSSSAYSLSFSSSSEESFA